MQQKTRMIHLCFTTRGFSVCSCMIHLRKWKKYQIMTEEEIKTGRMESSFSDSNWVFFS